MSIGIIGNGRFGQLIAKFIPDIKLYDIDPSRSPNTLAEISNCDFIIFAVPMRRLEESAFELRALLNNSPKTILDVCSVKVRPLDWLASIFYKNNVRIIGTHPLFGPQSCKDTLQGQRIVICPYSQDKIDDVVSFCEKLGLEVILSDPSEHDRQMAASQALLHFIGRCVEKAFKDGSIEENITMRTKSYDDMLSIINLVRGSSQVLFEDMQVQNPYANKMRQNFLKTTESLDEELSQETDYLYGNHN